MMHFGKPGYEKLTSLDKKLELLNVQKKQRNPSFDPMRQKTEKE